MAQTLAQKLVARAAGRESVLPGEIVTCRVDLAMMHDSGGPRRVQPMLEKLGAKVWDPSRVVVITDHYVPEHDEESRRIVRIAREWSRAAGIRALHDELGICHVVLPEQGHLRPGMFVVGGDSHSPTGGAFGAYMFGIGATEMLGVLVTGEIWLKVPETILIEWSGRLGPGLAAKDMMLAAIGRLGMDGGRYGAVEYAGEAVRALAMQERMTLANMTAELGGQVGLVTKALRWARTTASTRPRSPRRSLRRTARQTARTWRRTRGSASTSPTSARAPARSSTTCAWPPACCAAGAPRRAYA